jgi:hypothetical protein
VLSNQHLVAQNCRGFGNGDLINLIGGDGAGAGQGREDRVQPAVERPGQLQHRDLSPSIQWVVVGQFQQRVIDPRAKPGQFRRRQDLLSLRGDQRDDQQVEGRESGAERCRGDLVAGVRTGRGQVGEVVKRCPVEDGPGQRLRGAQTPYRSCEQCPVVLKRRGKPELIPSSSSR